MKTPTEPLLGAAGDLSRERAMLDIEDIKALERSDPFNRYFLRRLDQKRAEAERKFKYDPAEKCTPERREEYRQVMLALEDIQKMMTTDEAACRSTLTPR